MNANADAGCSIFIRQASEFPELAPAVALLGDRPIIFKPLDHLRIAGYSLLEYTSLAGEVVLAIERLESTDKLRRTFVHEVAHILIGGGHGIAFGGLFHCLLDRLGWTDLFDHVYDLQNDRWLEPIDRLDFAFRFTSRFSRRNDLPPEKLAALAERAARLLFARVQRHAEQEAKREAGRRAAEDRRRLRESNRRDALVLLLLPLFAMLATLLFFLMR